MSGNDRVQAHSVVQTCLDVACAVRSSSVKVRNLDSDGLGAALEVGAYGCCEYAELVVVRGLNADNGVGAEHVGADIESRACAVGRYEVDVRLDYLLDRLDELLLGVNGHFKTLAAVLESGRVEVGTEYNNSAVAGGVRLESLEYGLGILENARALADCYHVVGCQNAVVPFAVLVVGDKTLVGFDVTEAEV